MHVMSNVHTRYSHAGHLHTGQNQSMLLCRKAKQKQATQKDSVCILQKLRPWTDICTVQNKKLILELACLLQSVKNNETIPISWKSNHIKTENILFQNEFQPFHCSQIRGVQMEKKDNFHIGLFCVNAHIYLSCGRISN